MLGNASIDYYCYNEVLEKNYCKIFQDNFVIGWKLGEAAVIANALITYKVVSTPFLNRALEIGVSNMIETPPTHYSELLQNTNKTNNMLANPIYLGLARTNKYIPSLWAQNTLKDNFVDIASQSVNNPQDFLFSTCSRIVSDTIGATEKAITGETNKLYFTSTLYTMIATISWQSYSDKPSYVDQATKALYLNFKDKALASAGLVSSFAILDLYKSIVLPKISFELSTSVEVKTDNEENISNLTINSIIDLYPYMVTSAALTIIAAEYCLLGEVDTAIKHTKMLFSFSVGRAIVGTSFEIIKDYTDFSIDLSGIITIEDFGDFN